MTVRFIIDASSAINLANADALELAASLGCCRLAVSPLVLGECNAECAATLISLKEQGKIDFVDEDAVPSDQFLELLDRHNLGDGETEAIAVAMALDCGICCDDNKARRIGKGYLGDAQVVGSLRLLRWCVDEEVADCKTAIAHYKSMEATGGFLPPTPDDFFCSGLENC